MNTVFLDFDGVLFDSVKEAYLLSRYAYYGTPIKENIDEKHYKQFRKFRYLITHSWHFYIIFSLIEKDIKLTDFEMLYFEQLKLGKTDLVIDFDKKYVQAREEIIKDDYEFWDSLDIPFSFFFKIKELTTDSSCNFIILTNKKRLPVQNKLKKYGVNDIELFANEDLQNYKNKAEFICHYLKRNNINDCILVEDSIENINQCKYYPEIQTLPADWGYLNPSEKGLSAEEIIKAIKD